MFKQSLAVPGTDSTVQVTTTVATLEPRIDFEAEIDWREIGTETSGIPGLVLRFPLALTDIVCHYETPFGSIDRTLSDGEEVPSLRYACVEGTAPNGKRVAVTLLQDCKHGHALFGSDLCLRIVRSSYAPDHAPEVGKSTVRYSLFFHDEPPSPAELARLGAAWNHPLLVIAATLQSGEFPASRSFVRVNSPSVVLTALKKAEDGNGLILRFVELNGSDTDAEVTLDPALTAGVTAVTMQDLLERPVEGDAILIGQTLTVHVPALTPVTVRLRAGA